MASTSKAPPKRPSSPYTYDEPSAKHPQWNPSYYTLFDKWRSEDTFNGYHISHFIHEKVRYDNTSLRWRLGHFESDFSIVNMGDANYSHELLERLFGVFIDYACRETKQMFGSINGFSMLINSPLFQAGRIRINYGSPKKNTAGAVFAAFERVQQSHPMQILGEPLRITITAAPGPEGLEPPTGGRRSNPRIEHGVDPKNLIHAIINYRPPTPWRPGASNANWCLFLGLELGRIYHSLDGATRAEKAQFKKLTDPSYYPDDARKRRDMVYERCEIVQELLTDMWKKGLRH